MRNIMPTFLFRFIRHGGWTSRAVTRLLLVLILILPLGCGLGRRGEEREGFFTSGSREADQRADQRIPREDQVGRNGDDDVEVATLFDRLGGDSAIHAIVDDFIDRVIQDPRVNWARKGVRSGGNLFRRGESVAWTPSPENVARVKLHMAQFLALATGGPAHYEGQTIESSHEDMRITNAEFDATVGVLKASLDRLQIPSQEQKELLAIIESTRPQIVTHR
jgi:truncated hemoglobin YjbI